MLLRRRSFAVREGLAVGAEPTRVVCLDPSYNVARIAIKRRTANPWFKRSTLYRYRKALDVLRTATGPMTGADIARAVLAANYVTDADSKAAQTLAQAIQAALRNHAGGGAAGWRGNAGEVEAERGRQLRRALR
jgi:hypothetical protein